MAQPGPTTPSKATMPARNTASADPARDQAARLNRIYNLGLQFPDGPMSPAAKDKKAQQDPNFQRQNDILNLLRFHHFKGRYHLLATLDDFDTKAREQSIHWVRKPRASRAFLPTPSTSPRAQTVEDQVSLQELLRDVLAQEKESYNRNFSQHATPAFRPPPPSAFSQHVPPVTAPLNSRPVETIASPPAAESSGSSPEGDMQNGRARSSSTSSGSSSRSSAMFSARDSFEEPFESQTTAGTALDNEDDFSPGLRRSASEESFAISEAGLDALNETFDMYEDTSTINYPTLPEMSESPTNPDNSGVLDLASLRLSDGHGENEVPDLEDRLTSVFPSTPEWLQSAPFPIIWEMTRIAMYCGVDLDDIGLEYSPHWLSQDLFRKEISQHTSFSGKRLPEQSSQLAWDIALHQRASNGRFEQAAIFNIDMEYNRRTSGPLYSLKLNPLAIDLPHRLSRHFGADRFVELLFPSHHSEMHLVPRVLRNHEAAVQEVNRWLTCKRHNIGGREWAAFYVKDIKKPMKSVESSLDKQQESPMKKRVYLFCEDGPDFSPTKSDVEEDGVHVNRAPVRIHEMLDWLLQYTEFPKNRNQPFLKLFSRIALGLSRTFSTIVFEPQNLRHCSSDLESPTGTVMNDGIGRMSLSVARKLRAELNLSDLPTAVQGRLGSAKGMWILDPYDNGSEDWIETYPSQRKWECDFVDAGHRTLEVRNYASEARPSGLNKQFLSVLEDRALDKGRMRDVLSNIFQGGLCRDLEDQKAALEHPLLFSAWVHGNSRHSGDRASRCQVPFLGGLPDNDEEVMQFLLSGGFDPRAQKFLWSKAYALQKQKCEKLKEKLNVRVGRTAYLHMVVDFYGVLEEGEVQVCFSSKFQVDADGDPDENGDDGSFSDTLLIGTDVLVARSPAHFASDIQKVRVVFRQELCALKDVIVFSRKGDSPLADKLSGGDYDGDMAWVCWDPRIVDNFVNAPEPPKYDLISMGYMHKIKTTVADLSREGAMHGVHGDAAVMQAMIERGFQFNMKDNLLGKLTTYKEDLCYWRGIIDDKTAVILSTLLSNLVDQAKQGIIFTEKDFTRLRKEQLQGLKPNVPPPSRLPKPAYKNTYWPKDRKVSNFIDHLKFFVAKPIIARELNALNEFGENGNNGEGPSDWDPDLVRPAKEFEDLAKESDTCRAILDALKSDIQDVQNMWKIGVRKWRKGPKLNKNNYEDPSYRQRILDVYQQWCDISMRLPGGASAQSATHQGGGRRGGPAAAASSLQQVLLADEKAIPAILQQEYLTASEHSQWSLLKASMTYRMCRGYYADFVWRLAGRQLQAIKAMMTYGHGRDGGLGGSNVLMTPQHYAASRPDSKTTRQMVARLRGVEEEAVDYECEDPFIDDV